MANKLFEMVNSNASRFGNREVYYHKNYATNRWESTKWTDFQRDVESVSLAFEILGLKPQQCVAVFSQNMPNNLVTDFAAFRNCSSGIPTESGIFPPNCSIILTYSTGTEDEP